MMKNLWQNTKFYCMNHEKPILMYIKAGKNKDLFYACPKYFPEHRVAGERPCFNNMYTKYAEAAIEYFSSIIEDGEKIGITVNITNETWMYQNILFKVLKHDVNTLKIGVLNQHALAK